jgi:hypothetical protein
MKDENEEFVVTSLTRGDIAMFMNDQAEDNQMDVKKLDAGDDRLSSKFCRWFAEEYSDILDSDLKEEEVNRERSKLVDEAWDKLK